MAKGSAFYAVRSGRKPGIYGTWAVAEQQIKGFSGAEFKKFTNLKEAQIFLQGQSTIPPQREQLKTRARKIPKQTFNQQKSAPGKNYNNGQSQVQNQGQSSQAAQQSTDQSLQQTSPLSQPPAVQARSAKPRKAKLLPIAKPPTEKQNNTVKAIKRSGSMKRFQQKIKRREAKAAMIQAIDAGAPSRYLYALNFDGGKRGNGKSGKFGAAGWGYVIKNQKNNKCARGYGLIPTSHPNSTNNVAEIQGLISAIKRAINLGIELNAIQIRGDSQLVIEWAARNYQCHQEHLKPYVRELQSLLAVLYTTNGSSKLNTKNPAGQLYQIPRTMNIEADELANKAMDSRSSAETIDDGFFD